MKERRFKKKYLALISGIPEIKEGVIDAPIVRETEGNIKRVVRKDGKRAITEYKVIETLADGNSRCEIILHTGRTHQIRVHMAHIGHALVGDFLYGREREGGYSLVCSEISFPHPMTKENVTIKITNS